jgi:hypothetical protein
MWYPPRQKWSTVLDSFTNDLKTKTCNIISKSKAYYNNDSFIIRTVLKQLRHNENIIIKPADKNLGLCVLNPKDYINICMTHLNDLTTYFVIPTNLYNHNQLFASLRYLLNQHKMLHKYMDNKSASHPPLSKLAESLLQLQYHKSLRIAPFYCTIKVHKPPPYPGRPIVSTPSTPTYYTSVFLDKIFQKLLHKIPSICLSSRSVIKDILINPPVLSQTSVLLTADVTSLYPSIPTEAGIAATRRTCEEFEFMLPHLKFIIDLLTWVLNNSYMIFNNIIYKQIKGTAMGTPIAVCYANFFLYQLEKPIMYLCPYYRRYIDDIFAICDNDSDAHAFITQFNNMFVSIKLDAVTVGNRGIFLDLVFSITDHTLTHTLYQKPSNKYSYIPTLSAHHPSVFDNFILQELKRYTLYCTNISDLHILIKLFAQRLSARGYPDRLIALALTKLPTRATLIQTLTLTPNPNPNPKPVIILNIPRLSPNPNWRTVFTVPNRLSDFFEYMLAYPGQPNHILISKKLDRNISHLLMSSIFPAPD